MKNEYVYLNDKLNIYRSMLPLKPYKNMLQVSFDVGVKFERILFISGLEYTCKNPRQSGYDKYITINMYNIKDVDRYICVLITFHNISINRIEYEKEKVKEFFK